MDKEAIVFHASGQGSHWLIECATIFHLCVTRPPERFVKKILKHIQAAIIYKVCGKCIPFINCPLREGVLSDIQSTLMTFGGICDKMHIHMHVCIHIMPTNAATHTGTHATYIINLLNRYVLFMWETQIHTQKRTLLLLMA